MHTHALTNLDSTLSGLTRSQRNEQTMHASDSVSSERELLLTQDLGLHASLCSAREIRMLGRGHDAPDAYSYKTPQHTQHG